MSRMSEYSHLPMFNGVNLVVEFRVWPSKSSQIDTKGGFKSEDTGEFLHCQH